MTEKDRTSGTPEQNESVLSILDDVEEEVVDASGAKVRRKGVYLLPNLFTTIAMFAGFFAIISGMKGNFAAAGFARGGRADRHW